MTGNVFDEYERELEARANTPEARAEDERLAARNREKSAAEFEKGVRLGWWDAEGNPLNVEPEEDEGDESDGD